MMMNVSKGVFTLFITIVLTACSSVQIEGSWVEPVPGMPEMVQGVTLENGGKATSINMATMQYEFWEKKGDKLVLSGKSIGNHQTISFSDTLQIEELTTENLVLKKGDLVINYQRQNKSQGGLV
ncbi:lipocalin family protein [uncultured Parabacteroides sp.]|jgi:hypothetical protein|uniref:lipocalin family protein n=1 Tax=uncultured Parabacteroides sp. TaxID=512312 RepID=UPI0025DFDFF1|nr:lipocalin family protein [uncultured Parabacteroides sp.]